MKVLVIGSGGREHAIAWKLDQSEEVDTIYCAPGNGGTQEQWINVPIEVDDIEKLADFAQEREVDLTVVGPELPLVLGVVDVFEARGLRIFGPNKSCARFEGSKAFTKDFLMKYRIPTAKYKTYTDVAVAIEEIEQYGFPVVVKADGLAAGKGVIIAEDKRTAVNALEDMMGKRTFGSAGETVVLEEFLTGVEASVLCFVDGKRIIPMESAQDYKRAFDHDLGSNTGGMGAYSPNRLFDKSTDETVSREILTPIMDGFQKEGLDYRGVLFIGLMIDQGRPKVLEFNVRFGDPETEVVLPRLKSDLLAIFEKTLEGSLMPKDLTWYDDPAVGVVLASGGYPEKYEKGKMITGVDQVQESLVFHCGTDRQEDGLRTAGGRVLVVSSLGKTIEEARKSCYEV